MARVTLEEKAFVRFEKIARILEWDVRVVAGAILFLWHESQDREVVEATREEICRWAEVGPEDQHRFIEALVQVEVLRPLIEGQSPDDPIPYHISGNAKHIAGIAKTREGAQRGGKVMQEYWARKRAQQGGPNSGPWDDAFNTGGSLGASPGLAGGLAPESLQARGGCYNTIQYNTLQNSTENRREEEESVLDFSTAHGVQTEPPPEDLSPDLEPSAQDQGFSLTSVEQEGTVPRGTTKGKGKRKAKVPCGAIPEFSHLEKLKPLLEVIPQDVQLVWLEGFVESPDDLRWLKSTLLNIVIWMKTNPGRGAKPGGARFPTWVTAWLKKDYDRRPTRGAQARPRTRAEAVDQSHEELIEQIKRGEV